VKKGRRLAKEGAQASKTYTPEQRLLILDTWQRSGLPAGDFAPLVGISKHTLYFWKKRFERAGPEGLLDRPVQRVRESQLPELTKRTILMLKEANPEYGCQRISDMLRRGPALPASPSAVARVLHEAGYELQETLRSPHEDRVRSFERAKPNQLWQTDLFTFILKRQNRRVYLVAFMDDHSRFLVAYGLHASQSSALVLEVLRAAIASYGTPQEVLTDNGSQYVTWRGKSAFAKELQKLGVKQVVAAPRHPQTLGKIERFWGSLWGECLEAAVFLDLEDARRRIGLYIDHYNFQRPHQGIGGLVPADRFFGAAPEVLKTLKEQMAANALELARKGTPKPPFYVTGQVGGKSFSLHAEGERVILSRLGEGREEVELVAPETSDEAPQSGASELPEPLCPDGSGAESIGDGGTPEESPPGTSPLVGGLRRIGQALFGSTKDKGGEDR
jgi:transposase InsO family protein